MLRATVALLAVAAGGGALAAPPVAPAPEPLVTDAAIVPAAHAAREQPGASDGGVPLGPVPLRPAAGGGAPPTVAPQPLPDWRLLLALGGTFAAVAAYRVVGPRRSAALPPDVFEVLGEAPLGGQQSVRVIRFGPRTLLVAVSSTGSRTLAEVNDPQVTERIVSACHGLEAGRGPGRGPKRLSPGRGAAEARS
ncbi:MAG: flagellar biosynthetic protein FliO [Planctomycetaceae bacterium]